jgi:hypothetical protein
MHADDATLDDPQLADKRLAPKRLDECLERILEILRSGSPRESQHGNTGVLRGWETQRVAELEV